VVRSAPVSQENDPSAAVCRTDLRTFSVTLFVDHRQKANECHIYLRNAIKTNTGPPDYVLIAMNQRLMEYIVEDIGWGKRNINGGRGQRG
jgi:hypothetical protein